ncbi:uncharacterized protein HD556DRAFT_663806 [Suillus plorans]|uniref:MARVEL domain-containing protein n=1 Tax=Suillus plorans TaxID=116603 RepID=A0A9P7AK25_9AGAM|nr:uncharacterized protein HD556DRAFT_663806 [Suillus plorans]KAG1791087.1 hypothetical protein HD556DRAFT_663806 [Suillus plorans]
MSQLRSQLQNLRNPRPQYLRNPRPQYLVINTNPCPPQLNSLPCTMALDTHRRMGHLDSLHHHWRTPWTLVVSSLIIFCSIIVLSISAWLTSRFTAYHNYFSLAERDRTRFLLFTSAWTIVFSSLYMILSFCLPGSVLGSVLFLTWLFWTAGATSMTTALSGELDRKTQGNFVYPVQLNALEGFAWVTEALVTFALLAALIRSILAARRRGMRRPLAA